MNPGSETPQTPASMGSTDLDSLLDSVASEEAQHAAAAVAAQAPAPAPPGPQPYDFRNPSLLSPRELRKLRMHQEEFIQSLASRLSLHLRLEFSLTLTALQTMVYAQLVETWANPSHLSLFKLEPLRGVSILEIQPALGMAMVDRLMGGPGRPPETLQEMSEIEKALLEQTVQLMLEEWCAHWAKLKPLKPVILGYESNGRYIQSTSSGANMLVLSLAAQLGECKGQIQFGIPFAALEPLLRQLNQGAETAASPATAPDKAAPVKWNNCFDDVCIPVTAEWLGMELTAREVLALKVGDVLPVTAQCAEKLTLRLDQLPKFNGRPGTVAGRMAVEITQINRD